MDRRRHREGCGARRRIDPRNRDGRDLCSDCASLAAWFVCRDCGDEARLPSDGRCRHCQLIARLAEVFGDADGASKELSSLRRALATTERPRAVLRWLAGGHTRQVLAGLVSGQLALTHEALDSLGNSKALDHLRQVLVATAALPGRDEELARLEAWIDVTVAAVDNDEDRRLVEAFARWWILRRHRQRAARKGGSGSTTHARTRILAAVRLLAWLREHERALATCCQPDLDLWVVSGPAGRTHAADFVKWAVRQRQAEPGLRIVRRPDAMPGRTVEVGQQLHRARRLLTDDSLELRDRVAGLFVLLYAQPLSRIARVAVTDITDSGEALSIRFATTAIDLPDAVAALVRQLVVIRRGRATTGVPATTPWLFPSLRPGQPLHPDTLQTRLNQLGIEARASRTSTLLDLAAEVPVTVLADLLGMHPNVAARWVRRAAGDWSGYVASRVIEEASPIATGPERSAAIPL